MSKSQTPKAKVTQTTTATPITPSVAAPAAAAAAPSTVQRIEAKLHSAETKFAAVVHKVANVIEGEAPQVAAIAQKDAQALGQAIAEGKLDSILNALKGFVPATVVAQIEALEHGALYKATQDVAAVAGKASSVAVTVASAAAAATVAAPASSSVPAAVSAATVAAPAPAIVVKAAPAAPASSAGPVAVVSDATVAAPAPAIVVSTSVAAAGGSGTTAAATMAAPVSSAVAAVGDAAGAVHISGDVANTADSAHA